VSPDDIAEGFKQLDDLYRAVDRLMHGPLGGAAVRYLDLLKGEVVDGQRLVNVEPEED
jgi:hypothetical protein